MITPDNQKSTKGQHNQTMPFHLTLSDIEDDDDAEDDDCANILGGDTSVAAMDVNDSMDLSLALGSFVNHRIHTVSSPSTTHVGDDVPKQRDTIGNFKDNRQQPF